jgi:hypothetical protein
VIKIASSAGISFSPLIRTNVEEKRAEELLEVLINCELRK